MAVGDGVTESDATQRVRQNQGDVLVPRESKARRVLTASFVVLAVSAIAALALPPKFLVAARAALFNRRLAFSEFRSLYDLPPGQWVEQEEPALVTAARQELLRRTPELVGWLTSPRQPAQAEAAAILGLLPSVELGCRAPRDLFEKSAALLRAATRACCSDYVEVFQLLASLRGLATREISNARHTYVEYWDAEYRHWNLIDPTFRLVASQPTGLPADALEVAMAAAPLDVTWHPIEGRSDSHARVRFYSAPEAFATLVVTERSDILAQDAFDRHLRFLPKALAQFVELVLGQRPRWSEGHLDVQPASAAPEAARDVGGRGMK